MAKKINPRRKPATQADVNRMKGEAISDAVYICWVMMFSTLRDKEGWGKVRLKRLWDNINDLSGSVKDGYCTIDDLAKVLAEEADIRLER